MKLQAERRAEEILAGMEKQGPGEYKRSHDVSVSPKLEDLDLRGRPTGNLSHDVTGLADMGITRTQSHRWQDVVAAPA